VASFAVRDLSFAEKQAERYGDEGRAAAPERRHEPRCIEQRELG
jgi:hypothetical protein